MELHPDVVVIGSGMGGASFASRLAPSGATILVLERGERLAHASQAFDSRAVFREGHYRPEETWLDGGGRPFRPGNYYNVGGNSKFYGANLIRFRAQDFGAVEYDDGTSPAWPFGYETLAPYYDEAEQLFQVCGAAGEDPTEPPRGKPYPRPPVPDEPRVAQVRARLATNGLHPFSMPIAIDLERWRASSTITWDSMPDVVGAKGDAENRALKHALDHPNVSLWTGARVERLILDDATGRIEAVELERHGETVFLSAGLYVLAAGAVNSAALLLRSAQGRFPNGLANSADQVGRRFMNHNCAAVLAIDPLRRNPSVYQKTLGINDFYLSDRGEGRPLGNIQMLGKVDGHMLKANAGRVPFGMLNWLARHSVDWYVLTEDFPSAESRVRLDVSGRIVLDWRTSNLTAFRRLIQRCHETMRAAGFPLVLSKSFDARSPSHQCGTVHIGDDPARSPLDPACRSYDHPNLFVADASVLPASAAVNPALTVAAMAMRAADHVARTELGVSPTNREASSSA